MSGRKRIAAMPTDTSEKGLESLIVRSLVDEAGYTQGSPGDYDREFAVDLVQLRAFIEAAQPAIAQGLELDQNSAARRKFLTRLQGEISKRGVLQVLRRGVESGPAHVDLFYGSPSPGNQRAAARFEQNIFSITRQLRYSRDESQLSLDLCLFINGLPIATFELKNSLTKQTTADAVLQYKRDRDPRELLFQFGRCVVHFAVDDSEAHFCTKLEGKHSWFLPFNKGFNDGAGNPPNPNGLKTDYLWREILTKSGLTDIIENYAQLVEVKHEKTGRTRKSQIFPRYHQLSVVRKLLADALAKGAGRRYLIQHSAGSGKSNSIAWLSHQLIGLAVDEGRIFDSVIVVTDRTVLDRQIRDTIKQFAQVAATIGHAKDAGDLRRFIEDGKKIIISTVQKFPFILDEIGGVHRGRKFAIIIDEAHSSQGSRTSAKLNMALSAEDAPEEDEDIEDQINAIIQQKKMLPNASYFAFTATPKNKTLEVFGDPNPVGDKIQHLPFHSYTMKQAIQEGFILDVLRNYTTVSSYYRLIRKIEEDPEFDSRRAQKKLRRFVEGHEHAIRQKAEIMVDHFLGQVIGQRKIAGEARAMVVTGGIRRAIEYYHAISKYLTEQKSAYKAIVAFSGEHEFGGTNVTETSMNGFPSGQIEEKIVEDPYRILVCADKFQTGYDEPLLHTMYVDKTLSGIKAVQTLSRLNRAHPKKHDTFVLDFANDADTIQQAFADYYRTTILAEETDPDKLHDLKADLDGAQVFNEGQIDEFIRLYFSKSPRELLDPILDACVSVYREQLDEDGQVRFKGDAKGFVRTYGFLGSVLPYSNKDWEKLSIFLNFLIPKLPAPQDMDFSKGILEAIDMESYRAERQAAIDIALPDANAMIDPVPTSGGGHRAEPELDKLSIILQSFNDQFGNIEWRNEDRIRRVISEELPARVGADEAYQNAILNSDRQNARIEHDKALARVMTELLTKETHSFEDHTELFKQFSDNPQFKRWLLDTVFRLTYDQPAA